MQSGAAATFFLRAGRTRAAQAGISAAAAAAAAAAGSRVVGMQWLNGRAARQASV